MTNNLKRMILSALLIAAGFIFRQFIPTIGTIKPDGLMAVAIVVLYINRDFKGALLTGIVTGIIAALTTAFPGGQIPIFIDKVISCMAIYLIIKALGNRAQNFVAVGAIGFIGTLISGAIFLVGVITLAGFEAPFIIPFTGIVIPAALFNIPLTLAFFHGAKLGARATGDRTIFEELTGPETLRSP